MANRKTHTKPCRLHCIHCNNLFVIHRRKNSLKEMQHIKHIWCIKCQSKTKHIENNFKKSKKNRFMIKDEELILITHSYANELGVLIK